MKRHPELTFIAAILLASSSHGFGQAVVQDQLKLTFTTGALYRQAPNDVSFRKPGTFSIGVVDGSAAITGCGLNGSLSWFPITPPAGCRIGATAYIASGDLNNDGVRDDFSYWEITGVTPAIAIEPNRPDLCKVYSHPWCNFPMNMGFFDGSSTIFYNVQTESVKVYKISSYSYAMEYATRGEMEDVIVPGEYTFLFPTLRNPDVAFKIPVVHRLIPEGYRVQNHVGQGFRYTKLNGSALVWSPDGYVEMDPRLINTFEWEGNGVEVVNSNFDTAYFAILDLGGPYPGDPERDVLDTTVTLFPGFFAPGTARVLLPNANTSSFSVPPGFVKVVTPAIEGVAEFTLVRSAATNLISTDVAERKYQMPVRFVNTYEGWAAVSFPVGTPSALREKGADPDGDGYSNYQEWLGGTDPMLATSHPAAPKLAFVQGRSVRSTSSATPGHWETKMTKAQTTPPNAYQYEFSTDMQNWRPLVGDIDPEWVVTETDKEIKVQSKAEKLTGSGFLRVKMTEMPQATQPDMVNQ